MKLTLKCDPLAVRRALQNLRQVLVRGALTADDLAKVEIVLAEVLNNIVEHACANRRDCQIEVEMARDDTDLLINVTDDGIAMANGALPSGSVTELSQEPDTLPEGGFGWFLIRDLAKDLRYARRDGKNHLSFALELAETLPTR